MNIHFQSLLVQQLMEEARLKSNEAKTALDTLRQDCEHLFVYDNIQESKRVCANCGMVAERVDGYSDGRYRQLYYTRNSISGVVTDGEFNEIQRRFE